MFDIGAMSCPIRASSATTGSVALRSPCVSNGEKTLAAALGNRFGHVSLIIIIVSYHKYCPLLLAAQLLAEKTNTMHPCVSRHGHTGAAPTTTTVNEAASESVVYS